MNSTSRQSPAHPRRRLRRVPKMTDRGIRVSLDNSDAASACAVHDFQCTQRAEPVPQLFLLLSVPSRQENFLTIGKYSCGLAGKVGISPETCGTALASALAEAERHHV